MSPKKPSAAAKGRKRAPASPANVKPTPAAPQQGRPPAVGAQAAPAGAAGTAPAGLDGARHAALQKAARQAEVLRADVFSSIMADAVGYTRTFEAQGYRVFLEQLIEDMGSPTDRVERMMIEQLALAHYRIAQLHASAGHAQATEAAKILNAAAARMLGEFRRTALALRAYRAPHLDTKAESKLKIFKAAQ